MNSIFKKFGSVVLMLAMAANVNAQEMVAKIAPVSIAPGEEAEIAVAYENTTEFSYINMQVDFTLPEGLSFVETESVDEDYEPIMVYGVKGDAALTSHNLVYNMLGEEGKTMRFSLQNMKMKNLKPSGTLFTFKVKADESLAESSTISVTEFLFAGDNNDEITSYRFDDFTVEVTRNEANGIQKAELVKKNGKTYNLNGVVVNNNTKQIRVRNGKKFVQ